MRWDQVVGSLCSMMRSEISLLPPTSSVALSLQFYHLAVSNTWNLSRKTVFINMDVLCADLV
jgi:hypothetical protein